MSFHSRSATPSASLTVQRVDARRLLWVAPLTMLAALLANIIVQTLVHTLFPVTQMFSHLMFGDFVPLTVGAVGAACLVFAVVAQRARQPITLYRRIAVVALAVTLIPDALMFAETDPTNSTAGIVSLMVMHVVDAALCVGLLTTLPRVRGPHGELSWTGLNGLIHAGR